MTKQEFHETYGSPCLRIDYLAWQLDQPEVVEVVDGLIRFLPAAAETSNLMFLEERRAILEVVHLIVSLVDDYDSLDAPLRLRYKTKFNEENQCYEFASMEELDELEDFYRQLYAEKSLLSAWAKFRDTYPKDTPFLIEPVNGIDTLFLFDEEIAKEFDYFVWLKTEEPYIQYFKERLA